MFNSKDEKQFESIGIDKSVVLDQVESMRRGFPFLEIVSPATTDRGIMVIGKKEQKRYSDLFNSSRTQVTRFIPASGAATRMFKELYEAIDLIESGNNIKPGHAAYNFFLNLEVFPFYDDLKSVRGFDQSDKKSVLRMLLEPSGLNYGSLPKGLLKFHRYNNGSRTAFEEQIVESILYAQSVEGGAKLMFTVSEEHLEAFKSHSGEIVNKYKRERGVEINTRFSIQSRATDTIALDSDGNPFRNEDGSILFRPAGHGALLNNLQELESDIVFIKNIDNVTRENFLDDTAIWKETIAGVLIETREQVFSFLRRLDGESDKGLNSEIVSFLRERLCTEIPDLPEEITREYLYAKLNRPIRVCGMVRNEGEPGGGPFIVKEADGSKSLQILEAAQLNKKDTNYGRWMSGSTHFNPVDIVCSLYNYQGEKFNLSKFIDNEACLISNKSLQGRSLMALELPGLWNGGMSNWNTIFVEVPISTFNPVKTVNDLLRPQHSGKLSL